MNCRLAGLVCAAAAALAVPQAQQLPVPQPPPYVERVDVSSIVIDARVIDQFGAPILGLAASDFFVTIGGKPVKVQSVFGRGTSRGSRIAFIGYGMGHAAFGPRQGLGQLGGEVS